MCWGESFTRDAKNVFAVEEEIAGLIAQAFPAHDYRGRKVLLIIPDGTRTAPVGMMFKALHRQIGSVTAAFDALIALGTHPGRIVERVEVGIPRPRTQLETREDPKFLAHRHRLFGLLQGH